MKARTFLLLAMAISTTAVAQQAHETNMKEGIMKREGKLWYIKAVTDSVTIDNGIKAYADGRYKTTDNKVFTLDNGGRIDFNGAVEDMNQRLDEVTGMVVRNNNFMWEWTIVNKPIKLTNGNYVCPDGTLRYSGGKYAKIKDKEFIDFDGNINMASK